MRKINQHPSKGGVQGETSVPLGRAKGWFCTWPQCSLTKEEALKILDDRFNGEIQEYIIAEEKHKSGDPHLHGFIKFKGRKRIKSRDFDLDEYHGNYQVAKSWKAVARYCTKENEYISNFNVESAIKKKGKLTVEDLKKDALDLLEEGRLNPMSLNNFLKNQTTYKYLLNKRKFNRDDASPVKKRRHEWLYGESNTGKTTILRDEMKDDPDNWFQIPYNNDWQGYTNQEHLYADEFKGQLKINELNRICDGGAKMNTKGGTITLANDVIVHIASNYSIEECYNEARENIRETLYNRFIENKLIKKFN